MQFHFNKTCNEHPDMQVNYVYQQDMDSLKLGCFSCVGKEEGTFFYNLKQFIHQVEELVKERLEMYKKGNHLYYEINELLDNFHDKQQYQNQYSTLEQITSFFEINEDNYKIQFATSNQCDATSNHSYQSYSDKSDYESSHQKSSHSLHIDGDHDLSNSDSEILCPERNSVEFSLKQRVKTLKKEALQSALEKCQDFRCHTYLPFMSWKQFQQYSQFYINKEFNYFYHIYSEQENELENNNTHMIEEYESRYSPTRSESHSIFHPRSQLSSPRNSMIINENLSQIQHESNSASSNHMKIENDHKYVEDGRYFHECMECAIISQQTQDQIDILNIMFQDIKQIIGFKNKISPFMTFSPLQVFWDLRMDQL